MHEAVTQSALPPPRRWSPRSIAILILAWLILQIGGLFSPGLLDDVDSIYIEIAREMLRRHDFVTPYINGIRFFDKPPLMYWMAAGSMHLFGIHDWAARLPLALSVLALLLAVYALGIRLFSSLSPAANPDRGGFYAALALATSIGPYLYTRFYIPDILLALWMTLAVHLTLIALDRLQPNPEAPKNRVPHLRDSLTVAKVGNRVSDPSSPTEPQIPVPHRPDTLNPTDADPLSSPIPNSPGAPSFAPFAKGGIAKDGITTGETSNDGTASPSALLPCLAFAAVMAANVLTKGLIGLVFPIGFVLLYLALTRQLRLLPRLHLVSSTALFLALAAPWHILAALRTPAIALPPGLGLPATGGWAWFYLYNEHIARFLSKRIPHDYGQTPVWLFWLLLVIWVIPWSAFLPAAATLFLPQLSLKPKNRGNRESDPPSFPSLNSPGAPSFAPFAKGGIEEARTPDTTASSQRMGNQPSAPTHEAALSLSLSLWTIVVVGFFTISARQEYYSIPALPALTLFAGGALAWADAARTSSTNRSILRWSLYFLTPLTSAIAAVCAFFALTAPHPAPGTDISSLLAANPKFYNLSLGHLFDLTGAAMGLFRGPLAAVAVSMVAIGLGSFLLRRSGRTLAANLTLAAAMTVTLLAAHEGLARFYPILGSKELALSIAKARESSPQPDDLIVLDGELTSGSTLIFYTRQQVHLVNGRVNGLWYGSFWPDAPHGKADIFETEASLRQLWASPRRIFLFTYNPTTRTRSLTPYAPVHTLAAAGGKTILTNR